MTVKWLKHFLVCFFFFFNFQKGLTPAAPVHTNREDAATQTNLGFIHAFVAAISVIIVSELGDKTFFIAAIMAMRYNRLTVLAGAMLALALMTCLSGKGAFLGNMICVLNRPVTLKSVYPQTLVNNKWANGFRIYIIKTQILLLKWKF